MRFGLDELFIMVWLVLNKQRGSTYSLGKIKALLVEVNRMRIEINAMP